MLADFGKKLIANDAYFLEATDLHPAGYLFDWGDGSVPHRSNAHRCSSEEQAIVLTSRDAQWLEPGQAFVVSQLSFQLLANGSAWRNYASTGELITELNSPSTELGADVRVAVHTRMVQPVIDTTLLMLGLPLMFSRRQRNVFLSIGICLSVAIAFTLATVACPVARRTQPASADFGSMVADYGLLAGRGRDEPYVENVNDDPHHLTEI